MNISEFSIGDWVEINGSATKVWYLSEDSEINDTTYDYWVKPIPLTPEILEKNGWSRKNNYGWYLFYDKYIRINIWFDKDRWDIEVSSEDRRVTYADITGRGTLHTHQLQNALRLAGVGKEIEV